MTIVSIISTAVEMGLVFSVLAMGYYITYSILDFPDLTVEGTFLIGAVVFGIMSNKGYPAILGLILAIICGSLFGSLTGFLHVKCKIRPLLCGILVSTALISINLVLTGLGVSGNLLGESSGMTFGKGSTLHLSPVFSFIPSKVGTVPLRDPIIYLIFVLLVKFSIDLFLKTKRGLLLIASGDNPTFVTSLAKNSGNDRILGLAIGNGCASLSGALYSNLLGNVNQTMGIGSIVIGLASLIIGMSVFSKVKFMKPTTRVIFGAIIYQATLATATALGVPSAYNKVIMAIIFTVALILGEKGKKKLKVKSNA